MEPHEQPISKEVSFLELCAIRFFALMALLALAFGVAFVWFPSSAQAEPGQWGPWQRISTTDPLFPVEIQFREPSASQVDKKDGVGEWKYNLRNTSQDQGLCVTIAMEKETAKGTISPHYDARLKAGESWVTSGNYTYARRIISVTLISSVPLVDGHCVYGAPKRVDPSNASPGSSSAGGSGGMTGDAGVVIDPQPAATQTPCPNGRMVEQGGLRYCLPYEITFPKKPPPPQTKPVTTPPQKPKGGPPSNPVRPAKPCVTNVTYQMNACLCPQGITVKTLTGNRMVCRPTVVRPETRQ